MTTMETSDQRTVLADARQMLANGRPAEARTSAAGIDKNSDAYIQARWLMAVASMQLGEFGGVLAYVDEVLAANPKSGPAHNMRGAALAQLNRREEAEAAFEKALKYQPNSHDIAQNLGLIQSENGRVMQAFRTLEPLWRAGKLSLPAVVKLGTLALLIGETVLAQEIGRSLEARHGDDPDVLCLLNRIKQNAGDTEGAQAILDRILQLDPTHADSLSDKGILAMSAGESEMAAASFDEALKVEPGHAAAQFMRAHMGGSGEKALDPGVVGDRERRLSAIQAALENSSLPYLERVELNYAAGKVLDSLKRYDECFPYYATANGMLSRLYDFKIADSRRMFADMKKKFGKRFFQDAWPRLTESRDHDGGNLIYIVGLARSGTTLTEQILSRHPSVVAGGESNDAVRLGARLGELTDRSTLYPDFLSKIGAADLDAVAADYLRRIREAYGPNLYRTDKDLRNFLHLALIVTLFPKARIVHVRRNPIDTCVSCFFQYFKIYKHQYSTDLSDLGAYYRQYHDIMEHWRSVLPVEILSISYEELIADQRGTIERVLDHCGLPWDDACLDAQQGGSVRTASLWQVRQKLYKDSQERWRRYREHLGPLIDSLGDLANVEGGSS